jgi:hypothetical protein
MNSEAYLDDCGVIGIEDVHCCDASLVQHETDHTGGIAGRRMTLLDDVVLEPVVMEQR